jgi:hypothetical protein
MAVGNAERAYFEFRELVSTLPDLDGDDWATPTGRMWLGRSHAAVQANGDPFDAISFRTAMDGLGTVLHQRNVQTIVSILYRALAHAERLAPAALQGQFIAAGQHLSAFSAVAKVFARAQRDLLLVDGYADQSIVTDFAVTAPEQTSIRILTADKEARKQVLRPAIERWSRQFASRALSARTVPAATLHDRLILVDGSEVWILGQSFNGLAQRSHSSISQLDSELAVQKVEAYGALWASASPI